MEPSLSLFHCYRLSGSSSLSEPILVAYHHRKDARKGPLAVSSRWVKSSGKHLTFQHQAGQEAVLDQHDGSPSPQEGNRSLPLCTTMLETAGRVKVKQVP